MFAKLHARGRSFRGAAQYLLHDKDRAQTADRVAWTETRNLATDDPHVAWRVMAATAMDAPRLKQEAGIKNTGRKDKGAVLHLTLSWHPEQKVALTRDEMLTAGDGALRKLKADGRQVLIVCHNDEPQPHIHLLINRVSTDDGRMLSSSNEQRVLSRWAENYQKERGQNYCPQRVINNAARRRGEYVRAEPDKPRHIYELESAQREAARNSQIVQEERAKDAALARERAQQAAQRKEAWAALAQRHKDTCKAIRQDMLAEGERSRAGVRDSYRPDFDELRRQHDVQAKAFATGEQTFIGRARNRWQAVELRELFNAETRKAAVRQAAEAMASRKAREETLRRRQEKESRTVLARQRAEEKRQQAEIRARRDAALAQERARFLEERQALIQTQQREATAHRQEWQRRREERERAIQQARADQSMNQVDRLRDRLRQQREQRLHQRRDRHRDMGW